jgi:hypothetical protein
MLIVEVYSSLCQKTFSQRDPFGAWRKSSFAREIFHQINYFPLVLMYESALKKGDI